MTSRLHPSRVAHHPPRSSAADDVVERAIGASHRRAVLAAGEGDEATVTQPGVEVVVIRATDGSDGAMRLVRKLARLDDPPRIVVVGDRRAGPTEALAAGADAWIDQRAELETVLVAMHGRPRPGQTPPRRRWWRRRRAGSGLDVRTGGSGNQAHGPADVADDVPRQRRE